MRNYFLITGAWLAAAAATAFLFARLAAFGARTDAPFLEPNARALARPRRRRPSLAVPAWILAPVAMGCAAALLMADFVLAPEGVPGPITESPAQAVRMAEAPAAQARRAPRRPARRSAARAVRRRTPAPVTTASPAGATPPPVRSAPVSYTAPARPSPRRPRPQAPVRRPDAKPSPAPVPEPTAVAAAAPTPSPTPVPAEAPVQPAPSPAPEPDRGGPPAHARGGKKWTVHPPSKSVPGRVRHPKAPVGRPRCACR